MPGVKGGQAEHGLCRGIHGIKAAAPMDVQVDKTWPHELAVGIQDWLARARRRRSARPQAGNAVLLHQNSDLLAAGARGDQRAGAYPQSFTHGLLTVAVGAGAKLGARPSAARASPSLPKPERSR